MPLWMMDYLRKDITKTRLMLENYPTSIPEIGGALDSLEDAVTTEIQRLLWLRHIKEED